MDGLLVDSEPVWTLAETELAERYGARWTAEVKAECVGRALPDAVTRMLRSFGAPVGESVAAQAFLLTRMVELFHGALPLRPGAGRLLDALAEEAVPLALVSSSYRVLVDAALDTLGGWRFAVSVAGDEVGHTKPHPEPYLAATGRLGVDPARCVVVEDSPAGIAAGEAAGCVVVGVPDHAALIAAATRPVVASLEDVDARWLLGLPGRLRRAG